MVFIPRVKWFSEAEKSPLLRVPFVESLCTAEHSGMRDPAHSVQAGNKGPVHSSWPIVSYFSFLEDLRKTETSDPGTFKKSIDW